MSLLASLRSGRRPLALLIGLAAAVAALALPGCLTPPSTCTANVPSPPPNDNLANAQVVTTGATSGDNTCATLETGETVPCCTASRSAWYSWTPTDDGIGVVDTCGSATNTVLSIRTGGTVGSPSIASNDDAPWNCPGTQQSAVAFECMAGVRYDIQVLLYGTAAGSAGNGGALTLNVAGCDGTPQACPGPPNDCFANATALPSGNAALVQPTFGATMQTGEPATCGSMGSSVWFTWTATRNGTAAVDTLGSDFDTVLSVHVGSSVVALSPRACNNDFGGGSQSGVSFTCRAGTTYRIQAGGAGGAQGTLHLNVRDCTEAARYSGVKYVAVGAQAVGGPCSIAYSFDGVDWTGATAPGATLPCWGVAHNGTDWLAASAGMVWTSADGITWTSHATPMTTTPWGGVTWGNGHWVVAGGSNQVIYSTDAVAWSVATYPSSSASNNILGTSTNGTWWVSSGNYGIAVSPDGVNWNWVGPGALPALSNARANIFVNGEWYVGAWSGGDVARSPDGGATWSLASNVGPVTKFATDGLGTTVAIGSGPDVWTTQDMATWETVSHPFTGALYGLVFGDCTFIATGYEGNVGSSTDGSSWTLHPWPYGTAPVYAVATSGQPGCGPTAGDDHMVANEDGPAQGIDVLANDRRGTDGLPFQIVAHGAPSKGLLIGPDNGVFTYRPDPDAVGEDWFDYTISDPFDKSSTATVRITINPVDDAPSFAADPTPVRASPSRGGVSVPGWARNVVPGPTTAVDEATQGIVFDLVSNSNPGLFRAPPEVQRAGAASDRAGGPSAEGGFGVLSFLPSGASGSATLCFVARDNGDTQPVTDSLGRSASGVAVSAARCVEVIENAEPVAYFEPASTQVAAGQALSFDPCPGPVPDCSYDPDGAIAVYLWEFGDGATSSAEAPKHTYGRAGDYLVRLSVWDIDGAQATASRHVLVGSPAEGADAASAAGAARPPPTADAGPDRTVLEGDRVELSGRLLDGDPTTATFHWKQVAGEAVPLVGQDAPTLTFRAPPTAAGTQDLAFALQASVDGVLGPWDTVTVHVATRNRAPVADAGETLEVLAGSIVTLDASATTDPDGDPVTLLWEQVAGDAADAVDLSDAGAARPLFAAPGHATVLEFRLTASDGRSLSRDHVKVVVQGPAALPASASPEPPAPEVAADLNSGAPSLLPLVAMGALALVLAALAAAFVVRRLR